jgi:NhaA family Na+:H+ antiporter
MFIPTRPPANLRALTVQADVIIATEAQHSPDLLRHGPSLPALQALDSIHERMESPADRLLRRAGARSSYVVLPVFALANAGVVLSFDVFSTHSGLMLAIIVGLVFGKPIGIFAASFIAVKTKFAVKPAEYSWRQLAGAGAIAGIGFTMSLFIAGQAFADPAEFAAANIAVLCASMLATVAGIALILPAKRV